GSSPSGNAATTGASGAASASCALATSGRSKSPNSASSWTGRLPRGGTAVTTSSSSHQAPLAIVQPRDRAVGDDGGLEGVDEAVRGRCVERDGHARTGRERRNRRVRGEARRRRTSGGYGRIGGSHARALYREAVGLRPGVRQRQRDLGIVLRRDDVLRDARVVAAACEET